MRESAATLDDLGLHGKLAEAISEVQDKMGGLGTETSWRQDPDRTAQQLLAARRG